MQCALCDTDNRNSAQFCKRCGAGFISSCPHCGAVIPTASHFCDQCGEKLAGRKRNEGQPVLISPQSASQPGVQTAALQNLIPEDLAAKIDTARTTNAMVGERRVVTMLFCDVIGSTAAASQLDPEEWAGIMNEAFENMIKPIYAYEGTVARLMGDAILAFFGAPIAHEDDPQRAILAGLDIVNDIEPYRAHILKKWGIEIGVRVGINTGLVVVGAVGSDLKMEYTALGDAINLAARMEQTAKPGTVQISSETHRLIAPLFDFEDLGEIEVKGKSDPVQVFRVLKPKAAPGRVRGLKGRDTTLVGRGLEMDRLKNVLVDLQRGRGQIVALVGDAGLGKSRLMEEMQTEWKKLLNIPTEPNGPPPRWTQSQGISYEMDQPYSQWKQHLRQVCGITDADPADIIQEKLDAHVQIWPPEEQDRTKGVLLELLGVQKQNGAQKMEGEVLKRQLYQAMLDGFKATSGEVPPVISFDDLHWSDAASVDLLIYLMQLTNEIPVLFLCNFRPERGSSAWRLKETAASEYPHRYTEITLQPLTPSDGERLVDQLLPAAQLPSEIRALIRDKSDGNPFFIEEIIRALIESDVLGNHEGANGAHWKANGDFRDIAIPDSLQALHMARLDRLEDEARRVLQIASVVGRKFYYRVIERIYKTSDTLKASINALQQVDLIREEARIPELEYIFRHSLTQETAYRSILRQHRRDFHRQAGFVLEALYPDNLDELAPALGHHFSEAGEIQKAFTYYKNAGDRAFHLYANQEAISHYSKAIDLTAQEPFGKDDKPPGSAALSDIFLNCGRAYELLSDHPSALENYEWMAKVGEDTGDQAMKLHAMVSCAKIYNLPTALRDKELGEKIALESLSIAQKIGDHAAEAKIHWTLMNTYRFSSRIEEAVEMGERSIAIAEENGFQEILAYSLNDISHAYRALGFINKSLETINRATFLWRKMDNLPMLSDSLSTFSYTQSYVEDFELALKTAEEAYQISDSIDNVWGKSFSMMNSGRMLTELGEIDRAFKVIRSCMIDTNEVGFSAAAIILDMDLGLLFTYLGDYKKGSEYLKKALQGAEEHYPGCRPLALEALAVHYLLQQNVSKGAEMVARLLQDEHSLEPFMVSTVPYSPALLAYEQGEYDAALEFILARMGDLQKYGMLAPRPQALLLQGNILLQLNKKEEALGVYQEALAYSEKLNNRRLLWQIHLALEPLEPDLPHRQHAIETIRFIMDHIDDVVLKNSFLALTGVKSAL